MPCSIKVLANDCAFQANKKAAELHGRKMFERTIDAQRVSATIPRQAFA